VPAKVAGTWRIGNNDLTLTQTFQKVSGTLGSNPISEGRLRGDQITFKVGTTEYSGKVAAGRIDGTATANGKPQSWTATRQD
jgi:hypothetical protein